MMEKNNLYVGIRYVELICIAAFIFGFLWNGTDVLQLTFPQFMMLYGGIGAVVSEAVARIIQKKIKKNVKVEATHSG
jgi:hypothetical protein